MVAVFTALVLVPGNADFLGMNPVQASDPPLVSWVSVHRSESLCVGPSKGYLGFQFSPSFTTRWPEFPLLFTVRVIGISSSLAWDPGLGSS